MSCEKCQIRKSKHHTEKRSLPISRCTSFDISFEAQLIHDISQYRIDIYQLEQSCRNVKDLISIRHSPRLLLQATAIVESFRTTFSDYFDAIRGRVKSIHQSINQIATVSLSNTSHFWVFSSFNDSFRFEGRRMASLHCHRRQ